MKVISEVKVPCYLLKYQKESLVSYDFHTFFLANKFLILLYYNLIFLVNNCCHNHLTDRVFILLILVWTMTLWTKIIVNQMKTPGQAHMVGCGLWGCCLHLHACTWRNQLLELPKRWNHQQRNRCVGYVHASACGIISTMKHRHSFLNNALMSSFVCRLYNVWRHIILCISIPSQYLHTCIYTFTQTV